LDYWRSIKITYYDSNKRNNSRIVFALKISKNMYQQMWRSLPQIGTYLMTETSVMSLKLVSIQNGRLWSILNSLY
jgi:hypothetical protein